MNPDACHYRVGALDNCTSLQSGVAVYSFVGCSKSCSCIRTVLHTLSRGTIALKIHWTCIRLHCTPFIPTSIITTHERKQTHSNYPQTATGFDNGCFTEHASAQWSAGARPRASNRHHHEYDTSSRPPHRFWRRVSQPLARHRPHSHGNVVPGRLDSARQQERRLLCQARAAWR